MGMEDIVKAENLSKEFRWKKALSNLNFDITEHSITGLIGRNGSGKTTLLKIIAGILEQTSGEIQAFGEAPMDCLSVLNKLVYSYHNVKYESSFNLKTILYAYQTMYNSFDAEFANRLMKFFGLSGKMKYSALSQGMGSTFNFICTLSCRASLTIFDEPILGMDITVRKSAYEVLLRDFAEYPRTIIISSHLLSEIEGMLSHILLIEQGKLIMHETIEDMCHRAYRVDGDYKDISNFIMASKLLLKK